MPDFRAGQVMWCLGGILLKNESFKPPFFLYSVVQFDKHRNWWDARALHQQLIRCVSFIHSDEKSEMAQPKL